MRSLVSPALFSFIILLLLRCAPAGEQDAPRAIRDVRISAHRGGPTVKYPENALETIQRIVSEIPGVMVEIDVRLTKDQKLVLLHDKDLSRTTTGSGKLSDFTYAELSELSLKDWKGNITNFKIPLLEEVLNWSKNRNVYLSLDIKGKETFRPTIDMVEDIGVLQQVEVITYTTETATMVHQINPEVSLSVTIRNQEELTSMLETGIPVNLLSAFTGLSLKDESFYNSLHEKGIVVTLGVLGNLDKKAKSQGDHLYQQWKDLGVDRFATDRPEIVFNTVKK